MDYQQIRRDYVGSLEGLEKLTLQDLTAWWDRTGGTGFLRRRELLEEPFTAIAQAYGEQAARSAADYLFLQRSLDETLAGAAYPDVAAPVEYEQAVSAYRSATRLSNKDWEKFIAKGEQYSGAEFNAVTFKKLSGALNRLVLQPARETIQTNIAEGTMFARVPEPGACNWCLMLASRGAVYSADTAGMTKSTRYHDHCRCVAVEVSEQAPLPAVNRELEQAWKKATRGGGGEAEVYRKWKNYLDRRSKILQTQVKFPNIPGVKVPKYRDKAERLAKVGKSGSVVVPLPPLHQIPGHVLYGWRTAPPWGRRHTSSQRRAPGDYSMDNRFGHRHDSNIKGTTFPASWSDQEIVDAIRDVLEGGDITVEQAPQKLVADPQGNKWKADYDYQVKTTGKVGDKDIVVKFKVVNGVPVLPYGYPKGN